MTSAPEFSVSEELRFLAAQCAGQATKACGAEALLFLARLKTQLVIIGDDAATRVVQISIDDAARGECPRDMVRLAGTILNDRAARIDRAFALGMGDAA